MKTISILNHVLGPVMRGPSSSHTAGAFHIASMARSLLGRIPCRATFRFDPAGSYAATYVAQGADRSFAMGLMGRPLTEPSFFTALEDARDAGLHIDFQVCKLARCDHPNTVEIELVAGDDTKLHVFARSIGGGEVEITEIDGRAVCFNGSAFEMLLEVPGGEASAAEALLAGDSAWLEGPIRSPAGHVLQLVGRRTAALPGKLRDELLALHPRVRIWESAPVYFVHTGRPLFRSAAQLVQLAQQRQASLGQLGLAYECQLLGLAETEVIAEMLRRYDVMVAAIRDGLREDFTGLQLLPACAGSMLAAEAAGRLSLRSPHTQAAAKALAVMHVDGAMGVVCAAPTGGSAGVIPAVLTTLAEQRGLTRLQIAQALLAAGVIGLITAQRATFAAEVAGCQVEVGVSGAMAAAAVVEAVGGTAEQACQAAAVALQNTMGLVCDLLHGTVEIPCHGRNAAAAAAAFVHADLIFGGYANPIPLDETIDAVYAVGLSMPPELRCTSKGGLAVAPAAKKILPGR